MQTVWFSTPHKGILKDLCQFDVQLGTWVSVDGWVWPLWVQVLKVGDESACVERQDTKEG